MKAVITGLVMEVQEKVFQNGDKVRYVSLFQPGERQLFQVRLANGRAVKVGEEISLNCRVYPYATKKGAVGLNILEVE